MYPVSEVRLAQPNCCVALRLYTSRSSRVGSAKRTEFSIPGKLVKKLSVFALSLRCTVATGTMVSDSIGTHLSDARATVVLRSFQLSRASVPVLSYVTGSKGAGGIVALRLNTCT